jgi:hypothetical protein
MADMANFKALKDMAGQKFGRLLVLRRGPTTSSKGAASWICRCECGTERNVLGESLRSGNTQSCGCLQKEAVRRISFRHGYAVRNKRSRAYKAWYHMLDRCSRQANPRYHRYGGRGITVCKRWKKFENFLADMGEPPAGLSLDRINNDGPYAPDNCRWVTPKEQANNRGKPTHLCPICRQRFNEQSAHPAPTERTKSR